MIKQMFFIFYKNSMAEEDTQMKKIICYGIGNALMRRKLNILLSSKYEIIGYTDTFFKEDFLQGEKYIAPEHIGKYEYDYVVILAEKESSQMAIKENLRNLGVSEEKMIIPIYLYQDNLCFVPDLVKIKKAELDNRVDGVICGLSYSLYGIDEKKLHGSWVNFSWHSMDLYYNSRFLKMALPKAEVSRVLFCIPYYYFNYDISLAESQYKSGQIYACRGFNDWHNAANASAGVKNYLVNEEFFGDKLWSILGGALEFLYQRGRVCRYCRKV